MEVGSLISNEKYVITYRTIQEPIFQKIIELPRLIVKICLIIVNPRLQQLGAIEGEILGNQ